MKKTLLFLFAGLMFSVAGMAQNWKMTGVTPTTDDGSRYYLYAEIAASNRFLATGTTLVEDTDVTWTLSGSFASNYSLTNTSGNQFQIRYPLGSKIEISTNGNNDDKTLTSEGDKENGFSIYRYKKYLNYNRNVGVSAKGELSVAKDASYCWRFIPESEKALYDAYVYAWNNANRIEDKSAELIAELGKEVTIENAAEVTNKLGMLSGLIRYEDASRRYFDMAAEENDFSTLVPTVVPATNDIEYSSANEDVLRYENGQFVLVGAGTTLLTASAYGKSSSVVVTVINDVAGQFKNANFEDNREGLTHWSVEKKAQIVDNTTDNGCNGAVVKGSLGNQSKLYQTINYSTVPIALKVRLKLDRKSGNTAFVNVDVREIGQDQIIANGKISYSATFDWTEVTVPIEFKALTGNAVTESENSYYSIYVEFNDDNSTLVNNESSFYVDDIELVYDYAKTVGKASLKVTKSAKYGTFCAPFEVKLPNKTKAYIVETVADNGVLQLQEVESPIPANTPVVLEYVPSTIDLSDGVSGTVYGWYTESEPDNSGVLKGTYSDIQPGDGCYVLQTQGEMTGFYQVDSNEANPWVRANRCYIDLGEAASNHRALFFTPIEGPTAIETITADAQRPVYDLTGRIVTAATRGIVIKGGKKMIR